MTFLQESVLKEPPAIFTPEAVQGVCDYEGNCTDEQFKHGVGFEVQLLCLSHEALRIKLAQSEAASQQDAHRLNLLTQTVASVIEWLKVLEQQYPASTRLRDCRERLESAIQPDEEITEDEIPF